MSAPSSTRRSCSRSSSTAARHGTSQRPHWCGWRGFESELHSLWLRNTSLGEDQITCGSTRPPATCSRSVGCMPLHIILTSDGRQFSIRGRDRPIHAVCMAGEQRRGSGQRQWWWEQKILGRVDGRHLERPPKRRCRFILECGENNCAPHRGRLCRPLEATALTA